MMTSEKTGAAGMSDTDASDEKTADAAAGTPDGHHVGRRAEAPSEEDAAEGIGEDGSPPPARPPTAMPPNVLPELCEFAPLDFLLQQLPRKAQRAQRAFPAIAVEFTCLDVGRDLIVLGANFSMVFVYDRHENTITKLRCDDRNCRITCVKLLTSIDHQIAVGTSGGQVEVYLLPTKRPGQVFKELKKFLIDGGHRSNVTCAEWSANGMKLFTGDSVGNVVFSEVDFYENKCKSELRIKEDMPIVQLNYAHKILVVSTYARTVLCYTDENYRLQQVGQQPRKAKGNFGGHFVPALCKARDATLCSTRPGLRLWHAAADGTVRETLKFKHLLAAQHQTIMLLPSTRPAVHSAATELQFGPVLFYRESYVLTWSQNLLAVLELDGPNGARVVASSMGDLGSIVAAATTGEEIYILRRGPGRQLIRVAMSPEVFEEKEELTLSETEKLLLNPRPDHQAAGLSSPGSQRKTSFRQGLSVMKSIFSKAKEELADTTSKLSIPKFGRPEADERGPSVGSSGRSSQDEASSISVGETPDATLSPEVLAARFALRTDGSSRDSVASEGDPEPDGQTAPKPDTGKPSDPAADPATGGTPAPAEDASAEELAKLTLNEERLLKIGQKSFDDILFLPAKTSKKKKKKPRKASKKDLAERSCTPSPTPDGQSGSRARSVSDTDRSRSECTGSDSFSPRSESGRSESHSHRSNSNLGDDEEARSGSIHSVGSQDPRSSRSGSNRSDSRSPDLELENGLNSRHPEGTRHAEIPDSRSCRSASVNSDGRSTGSMNSEGSTDHPDAAGIVPGGHKVPGCVDLDDHPDAAGIVPGGHKVPGCVDLDQAAPGKVVLGGIISSSVDDIATRMATPGANSIPNPSPVDFPGTLRSWESAPDAAVAPQRGGGNRGDSTDTIHTLRSDMDSLKLDLGGTVPLEATEPSLQFQNDEEEWSPTSRTRNLSPTRGPAVTHRVETRQSDSTDEEIYGKYLTGTPSSEASSPPGVFPVEESQQGALWHPLPVLMDPEDPGADEGASEDLPIPENIQQRFAGSWMQCSTPGYIMQLVVSDKHVWCVDNRDKVYHSLVANVTISWSKLKDLAMLIASSPSGNIIWRLHRKSGTAFACAPISPHSPIGSKWSRASTGATHICLDEGMAWIIKHSGEIFVHKGISRDLPLTKERRVPSNAYVTQIAANRGVVWAISSNKKVMYRSGITQARSEGESWADLDDESVRLQFVSIALDSRKVGWAIDDDGLVWFRTGVTPSTPQGDDMKWWQVPMGEYLMQDPNTLKMLLNIAGTNATVDRMTTWLKRQYYRATHIAASATSVWVCGSYHYKSSLHFSKGNMLGSRWENGCPVGLPSSAFWVSVSATGVYGPSGMVWAAIKSGEVFCFPPDSRKPLQVDPPMAGVIFKHLSATPDTLWALQEDGNIYIRKQITERCPQGLSWKRLGLEQLGSCKIVHFSCGAEVVWACDNDGMIYLRIGVHIPRDESLPPAWVPVGRRGGVGFSTYFVQVFCSVDNRLVWALDNKRSVYVRKGICKELPVGREWEVVEGTQAIHLCISSSTVWALCPNGDMACRFGITDKNTMGDYWKKVPGCYTYLSVTQSDDLWAISSEGRLFQRFTKMFQRRGVPQVEQLSSPSGDDDWELL